MSNVQKTGERLSEEHGFLGVPTKTFDEGGRRQFIALLAEGVAPESRVLEIGSGCLRTAYWLIRLLEPENYCGIEPHRARVKWALDALFDAALLKEKAPRFDYNDQFDTSVFGGLFDYFIAGSIWTHCSKASIQTMLDGFVANAANDGVFLVSYLPAREPEEEYLGADWVGTSHRSNTPGIVRHSLGWIRSECAKRGLMVEEVPLRAFDAQFWLRVRRLETPARADRINLA